jgi:O-succinylbenzoate synthase
MFLKEHTMSIERFRLHLLDIPLVRPFRTSFGTQHVRDVLLVEAIDSDGVSGWGECVTMAWPGYSPEYTLGAIDVMRAFLIPALREALPGNDPVEVAAALGTMRGHPMAKSALSTALLDVWLRKRDQSLGDYLGAVHTEVDCGVSVGIPTSETIEELMEEVGSYVDAGYRRIKLKIEPGWDIEPVARVREQWPDIPLQVDANQAYGRADGAHLAELDPLNLLLIEQPLPEEDWLGHRIISEACATPICMDESILNAESAEAALEFGSATIINIKPGRVGGYLEAKAIHDVCMERSAPVWCGGMLETGIGRAANLALAAMPGFTLPGDTSASSRYYAIDVTEPFVLDDGRLSVPTGPGIGVDPIPAELERMRISVEEISLSGL